MIRLLFLALILLFSLGLYAQSAKVSASIDHKCNTVPASIRVPNETIAEGFTIEILLAGNNCYDGSEFSDRGFIIKNANGDIVYRYHINKKDEVSTPDGPLKDLRLNTGIYYVHVDGGNGAKLELSYHLN